MWFSKILQIILGFRFTVFIVVLVIVFSVTDSEENGPSEDTRNPTRAEIEYMGSLIELIDDEIKKVDNGRTTTSLEKERVPEDEGQCSNRDSVEFVGIRTEAIMSSPSSVRMGSERVDNEFESNNELDRMRRDNGKDKVYVLFL